MKPRCAARSRSSSAPEHIEIRIRKCDQRVNVKKKITVASFAMLAVLAAACGGAGPTPTRTPRAVADNGSPTQTPWIIYVPVTTTPEPFTITPLPTVTSSKPTPRATNTRTAKPAATKPPPTEVPPTTVAATAAPAASPTPSCGQLPVIGQIKLPEQGTTRDTGPNHKTATVQFVWDPNPTFDLDPDIGYLILITSYLSSPSSPVNTAQIFIPHNVFRDKRMAILDAHATYALTNGDSVEVSWAVTVVKVSTVFNDQTYDPGPTTPCAAPVGPYTFHLRVG